MLLVVFKRGNFGLHSNETELDYKFTRENFPFSVYQLQAGWGSGFAQKLSSTFNFGCSLDDDYYPFNYKIECPSNSFAYAPAGGLITTEREPGLDHIFDDQKAVHHVMLRRLIQGAYSLTADMKTIRPTAYPKMYAQQTNKNPYSSWAEYKAQTIGLFDEIVTRAKAKDKDDQIAAAVFAGTAPHIWPLGHLLKTIINIFPLTPFYFRQSEFTGE